MEEYIELRRKSNYKDLATQWFLTEKSLSDVGKSTDMYSMKSLDIKLGSFYFKSSVLF